MKENLFELTEEAISMSKMMYNDKIVKCLVAPYHSFKQLEEKIPYSPTTFLFPEREMSGPQVRGFINMIVKNPTITGEVRIITKDQNIITDMMHDCVKILTEGGDIVDAENKTFAANIHDIRAHILDNPDHQLSEEGRNHQRSKINETIEWLNNPNDKTNAEYHKAIIDTVGEPVIKTPLMNMYESKMQLSEKEILQRRIDELEARRDELLNGKI